MENDIIDYFEKPVVLASRGSRLIASIIDSLLLMPFVLFLYFYLLDVEYYFEDYDIVGLSNYFNSLDILTVLPISFLPVLFWVLINYHTLEKYGQTLGKRLLGIKVVTMSHELPPIGKLVFHRYILISIISTFPVFGPIFSLVDVFFIFRDDKRCIHDIIAGTMVVKAK